MTHQENNKLTWTGAPPDEWSVKRIKTLFHDDTTNITVEQLAGLSVDHYSIPAFDELGAPAREHGAAIASNKTLLRGGELLFSKLNSHKPRVWLVQRDTNIKVASTEFIALKEWHGKTVNKSFVRYLLGSIVFVHYISCFQSSVTNSHRRIKPEDLWRTEIPLPPLPEQERIADYLDETCAVIDAAVAAKRRQIDILHDLERVTITRAVTRGLDETVQLRDSEVRELGQIPAHWRQTKLRYEISVRSGDFASDKFEDDGEYPVIGGNGEMGRAALYNVDGEIVVVGRVGAYCGNTHYVKGQAWVSDNALIVESNHDKRFLTHLIRVLDFNSTAKKTAQPLVTGTQIKNTYVGMPPLAEQEEIVAFIEDRTAQSASLSSTLLNQITTLISYRKSLIHECVTGQRRITEEDLKKVKAHG